MKILARFPVARLGLVVAMLALSACAFQPRQVDVQAVEGRIAIPDVDYQGQYTASFLPVIDARPSKVDLGVGRNKMMMVTTSVSMKGDLASTMEKLVQKNFQAVGISNGSGPPTVKGKIIEAYTDANGPDHIFVRIRFELAIITGNNQPIFHDVLTGYSVVGVVQLGNSAHEMAFVEAMNQINDQVHEAAVATRQLFDDRGSGPSGAARSKSTGTGIVVSASGALVTNHHVVADCDVITVSRAGRESSAQLIFADSRNDLAVLQADADIGRPVELRGGAYVRPGDDVIAIGFPLQDLLSDEPKITRGIVNSLSGLGNDMRVLQISAPVQPGNSGGPLLDSSGHLIGIVTSKLDAIAMAEYVGDIPQNVNFALKISLLRDMLDVNGISYVSAATAKGRTNVDIFEEAKEFTVLIECR